MSTWLGLSSGAKPGPACSSQHVQVKAHFAIGASAAVEAGTLEAAAVWMLYYGLLGRGMYRMIALLS